MSISPIFTTLQTRNWTLIPQSVNPLSGAFVSLVLSSSTPIDRVVNVLPRTTPNSDKILAINAGSVMSYIDFPSSVLGSILPTNNITGSVDDVSVQANQNIKIQSTTGVDVLVVDPNGTLFKRADGVTNLVEIGKQGNNPPLDINTVLPVNKNITRNAVSGSSIFRDLKSTTVSTRSIVKTGGNNESFVCNRAAAIFARGIRITNSGAQDVSAQMAIPRTIDRFMYQSAQVLFESGTINSILFNMNVSVTRIGPLAIVSVKSTDVMSLLGGNPSGLGFLRILSQPLATPGITALDMGWASSQFVTDEVFGEIRDGSGNIVEAHLNGTVSIGKLNQATNDVLIRLEFKDYTFTTGNILTIPRQNFPVLFF